ncbi:MAG: homogentisate 1,2-dioxygenase, partial [Candidatus Limnocylindria bacterium]
MFYVQRGEVPHKRHTQFRKDDGGLYAEELFGVEGFSGRASLLYHHTPPTQTHQIEKVRDVRIEQSEDEASGPHRHRLVNTKELGPAGDGLTGRVPLFYNSDVTFGVVLPTEPMKRYYRNGEADEMYFVHTGTGTLETNFGPIDYGPGDYLVIPIGTIFRLRPGSDAQRMLWVESPSSIVPPKRYRNDFGQLLEHSPFCERDIRPPAEMAPSLDEGDFVIEVKTRGRVTAYHYRHHPFDLVGWDGHLWPFAFNIGDFEPITGRVHQPPPVHLTFQPRNYVICSFVPRKFDYHPLAIPAPYNHSNINSDEVIYYVAGNFMSRRGVD